MPKEPTVVAEKEKAKTGPEVIFESDVPADPECPWRFSITALRRLAFSPENKRPVDFQRPDSTRERGVELAVTYRGANDPRKGGIIPPLDVLESLGMVRTTKGATGDTYVDVYLLTGHARSINTPFGILVLRGFELWQHQQPGQEAPRNEQAAPPPEDKVEVDPSDTTQVPITATKNLLVAVEKNYAITKGLPAAVAPLMNFVGRVGLVARTDRPGPREPRPGRTPGEAAPG